MEPVGPEEPRTYWIRRAVVGGVVLAVVIAVIALVAALTGGSDDGRTAAPPPPSGPSLKPAETPTPTPTASPTSGDPSASGKESDDPDAKKSDDPDAKKSEDTKNDEKKNDDKKDDEKKDEGKKDEDEKADPKKEESDKPAPAACKPADLRTTLTGPRTVQPGKKVTFRAGVINGGSTACTFTLDPETYVFRIYSGSDKIWTTGDCDKWLPEVTTVLEPEADVAWKIDWTVQRSKGCELVDGELGKGTYAANSLVKGAPPAQVVMQLR